MSDTQDTYTGTYTSEQYNDLFADYQAALARENRLLDDFKRLTTMLRADLTSILDNVLERYDDTE